MPYLLGESVNIGVGPEAVRGTAVEPVEFIPGRSPSGVNPVADKVLLKETRNSRATSQGSIIMQKRVEGDLEFNVRNRTIGWLLYSLLGDVTVTPRDGVYDHKFTVLPEDPQNPSLSIALSQPRHQNYVYNMALVKSIEFQTPVDDLVNATASFIAAEEEEHADYTVAFNESDYYFRHYDVAIKIADDLAGLDAATAFGVKEFSLALNNNARPNVMISDLNPSDVIALLMEFTGEITVDKQDETWHDIFFGGERRAMRISMVRSDITIGGASNPAIVIDLPHVTFESWEPDKPIDDIVREKLSFVGHWDTDEASQGSVTVTSDVADYSAQAGS